MNNFNFNLKAFGLESQANSIRSEQMKGLCLPVAYKPEVLTEPQHPRRA